MIEIESVEQFEKICNETKDLLILDFYGVNCGPCRKIAPILEEVAEIYGDSVIFVKLCAQKFLQIFAQYQVSSVPTVLILSRNQYSQSLLEVKARLTLKDINKENLIALISEYKKDILLK